MIGKNFTAKDMHNLLTSIKNAGQDLSTLDICFESFPGTKFSKFFKIDTLVKYDIENQEIVFTEAP